MAYDNQDDIADPERNDEPEGWTLDQQQAVRDLLVYMRGYIDDPYAMTRRKADELILVIDKALAT